MAKTTKPATTETGAVDSSDVVRHSNPTVPGASDLASPTELAMALEQSQSANAAKDAEIARLRAQLSDKDRTSASDDAIANLAKLITDLAARPASGPTESDTLNKSTDFNNQRVSIDNRSLVEAQATVMEFRREPKVPISIPKSLANTLGPYVAVSVNGIRIAVNCDGKTYFINKTHAEHIRERIAKVDIYNATPGETVSIKA